MLRLIRLIMTCCYSGPANCSGCLVESTNGSGHTCPAEPPTCHWLVFTLPLQIFLQVSRRARSSGHCCSPSSLYHAAIWSLRITSRTTNTPTTTSCTQSSIRQQVATFNVSDCAEVVTAWHLHNGLLLNPAKTEALVTGTWQQVAKMDSVAGIGLASAVIPFAKTVKVLGVSIDQHLTFDDHISKVAGSFHYHIRALRHIRRLIDRETANTLACSIVATRLDYCNSVLSGITAKNITRL